MRHEIDCVAHTHHVKSVWSPVIEHLVLEKEPAGHSHNEFTVAVIKDSQIVGCTLLENLLTDHVVLRALLSAV